MFCCRGMRGGRVSELLIPDFLVSPLWPQQVLVKDKRSLLLEEGFFKLLF